MSDAGIPYIESGGLSTAERDRAVLSKLGKKPVLKRSFGFLSVLAFATTILVAWETTLVVLTYGLGNGGSAGAVWELIFIWFGVMLSFVVVSELASMAPVSGGQYHWVAMLAPSGSSKFLSYITGWMTICGWQGNTAVCLYLASNTTLGIVTLCHPSYVRESWHSILISLGMILYGVLINIRGGFLLPRFENLMLFLHTLGFFAVLITLAVMAPHQSASEVFADFNNYAGQPSMGISFFVGCVGAFLSFSGADGAIHMSEEIENASIVVPQAILLSYVLNGSAAFAILIVTLFSIQDREAALNSPTGYPFIEIFHQATGSRAGAAVLVALINLMSLAALVSSIASASRQLWSFARDHGVPGWQLVSKVEKRTAIPRNAIFITAVCAVLLQLINLGSTTVFQDLTSITVAGLYSSYLIAITLLLWRRCSGTFTAPENTIIPSSNSSSSIPATDEKEEEEAQKDEIQISTNNNSHDTRSPSLSKPRQPLTITNTANAPLTWGPWHVPGIVGIVLNVFACCFLATMWFFSFWPTELPATPVNMNYNSVLWGGVVLGSLVWYGVEGRNMYHGPVVETEE